MAIYTNTTVHPTTARFARLAESISLKDACELYGGCAGGYTVEEIGLALAYYETELTPGGRVDEIIGLMHRGAYVYCDTRMGGIEYSLSTAFYEIVEEWSRKAMPAVYAKAQTHPHDFSEWVDNSGFFAMAEA